MFQEGIITPSSFCVYEEYEIEFIEKQQLNRELRKFETVQEKYIRKSTDKIKRYLNPFDAPELITELLKVNISNDKSLLAFVHEYGLPEHIDPDGRAHNRSFNEFKFDNKIMPIDDYRLSQIKTIAEMWKVIGEKDHATMDFFIKQFGDLADKYEECKEEWEKVKNKELEIIVKALLVMDLNQTPIGTPGYRLSGKKIVPTVVFTNLYEVALWQLANAITQEMHFKTCENCGRVFLPQHGHQKFCPPVIGRKMSKCQNTFNQRAKRARNKAQNAK